jgi:hypothetical protein
MTNYEHASRTQAAAIRLFRRQSVVRWHELKQIADRYQVATYWTARRCAT